MNKTPLGAVIDNIMKNSEMTDSDMAVHYRCTRQYASQLRIKGCKTITSLFKLSNIFGIKPHQLLKLVEDEMERRDANLSKL